MAQQDSATRALEEWCAARGIAEPARIVAIHAEPGEPAADDSGVRERLEVGAETRLGYRHVRLACGSVVLSDAHNWYVPDRLTSQMNTTLETTDTPFGRAVSSLGFTRHRLASQRGAAAQCPADTILSHRAVLRRPDGQPISLVIECYTPANLG